MTDQILNVVCKSQVLPSHSNEVVNEELKGGDVSAFRSPHSFSLKLFAFELAPKRLDAQLLLQCQLHYRWR